jgi:hypothetical protein
VTPRGNESSLDAGLKEIGPRLEERSHDWVTSSQNARETGEGSDRTV